MLEPLLIYKIVVLLFFFRCTILPFFQLILYCPSFFPVFSMGICECERMKGMPAVCMVCVMGVPNNWEYGPLFKRISRSQDAA